MTQADQTSVTRLLGEIDRGNTAALTELFPLIYSELRMLAGRQRRRWHGNLTLNTTALLHEAYLKLVDQAHVGASSRGHFFAVAAKAMRHILCNYARDQRRQKRGGRIEQQSLDDLDALPDRVALSPERADIVLALDKALAELETTRRRSSCSSTPTTRAPGRSGCSRWSRCSSPCVRTRALPRWPRSSAEHLISAAPARYRAFRVPAPPRSNGDTRTVPPRRRERLSRRSARCRRSSDRLRR